ncbi:PQQ-binding-like beta-propeller repeat protein [Cellulomonas shaoxiangyii]|uniref:Pyrrolo-quinoline quinone repeat domain-containing protein n=1 Tax=Cellulomonas shaoxiangyii TaxID=2566013 RepID=A0A4V1CMB8_9CELL|nr:PQQ-binding-like beta-propeller repeat protein [Cellulomonas shaoxiangyii]QCB92395.1 hypothetical protein E5225_01340 [Cellulomonas shaoxiangyii]TGY82193.1 hypothetical protein E5226_13390 [Cellulomonas shaoxiangyii]
MTLHDVELVEDDEPAAPAARDEEPAARAWLRRHPGVVVALAVVLVGAVGTGVLLEHRTRQRDADRVAALQEVPGVLRPVDPALPVAQHLTWSATDGPSVENQALLAGVQVGDVTVVGDWDSGPDAVVAGVGAQGEQLWRTTVPPPDRVDRQQGSYASCTEPLQDSPPRDRERPRELTADVVACVVQWSRPVDAATAPDGRVPTVVALLELDPSDGRVVHRADQPDDASVTRVPGGWVTSLHGDDDVVVRLLAGDGTPRWSTTLPLPGAEEYPWSHATVRDDRVLVMMEGGSALLALPDGAVLARYPGGGGGGGMILPGGSVLLHDSTGGVRPAAHLHRPDGTATDLDGESLGWVAVDDGSLGDVLLTSGEGEDARTTLRDVDGAVRWRVDGELRSALVVDGSVLAAVGDELVRLDGSDGHARWRVALSHEDVQLMTDGAVVLATSPTRIDAWTYDGAPTWSGQVRREDGGVTVRAGTPAPSPSSGRPRGGGGGTWWVALRDGRLALQVLSGDGDEEVLVLG